jgi:hypothetical protein
MDPLNNPFSLSLRSLQLTLKTAIKLLLISLVIAAVPLALSERVDSKGSKAAIKVRAADRGKPYFNFQDGREIATQYRGSERATTALQSGLAKPRALTSGDFDDNATPDVVTGYAFNGKGIVTLQRGNPDAYAPQDQSVYERMQTGYNPDPLLPTVETFEVPQPADFVQIGDFNVDGRKDILVGARQGALVLLKGDESGGLLPAEQVELPGALTSLTAGQFRAADGKVDVAVGVNGPGGPRLLIYDGLTEGINGAPIEFILPSEASVIRFDTMDADPFVDAVVAAGSEILIVHGWGRKQSPAFESRIERVHTGSEVRGLSTGHFIWDREGRREIAALTDDGTLQLIQVKGLNTTKFTDAELVTRSREHFRPQITQQARETDVEAVPAWNSPGKSAWVKSRSLATNAIATGLSSLATTNMNSSENDEVVITTSKSEVKIVRQTDVNKMPNSAAVALSGDIAQLSLDSASPAVAALQLPAKLNGERSMLVLQEGATSLSIVPLVPQTITVDRFDDPDAGAPLQAADNCLAAASDCSLRGAIEFANLALAADQPTTINLPAGTYTLDNNGTAVAGCDNNPVGDLTINGSIAMVGLGGGAIIRQLATGVSNDGDRAMCINLAFAVNKTYSFSNLTIIGGRDGSSPAAANVLGGGGVIGGELDNTTNFTNVTFANNQVLGVVMGGTNNNLGGGGLQITGGDLNITNCTFGAANAPGTYADRTSTTTANFQSGSGGGLTFTPSSPMHLGGMGVLTVEGTTFQRNRAEGIGGGGADFLIFAFGAPGGIGSGSATVGTSTTFSNNHATGSGGGIVVESLPTIVIGTTNLTDNSADNRGGGIYVGGGSLLLNGAAPSIIFSGNTAPTVGSSISTAGPVTVAGTNTTIGGSIQIGAGGSWTNNAGSSLSPTDVDVLGGTFNMNNSTMNVSGNLTIGPNETSLFSATFNGGTGTVNLAGSFSFTNGGPAPGSAFNAGTGTFNFNGTSAQSISNAASITFFNLTDSNITQPLTLNNSLAVNGTLNVNGANAILSPVAATVISGTGTLTGTGTARVTRAGGNAFLAQYTMTTKTLTNLLVDYVGPAAQGLSPTTYVALRINNGNGVTLDSGTATVNGLLTLANGVLDVGAAPRVLVINNGVSVGSGTLTSAATGTVNYNQGTNGQSVIAGTYGNLTFSNFNKSLAGIGTIFVAGTFTPGTAVGHTIAGSTINFNATANAQTIPAFNYFNLSTSNNHGNNNITLVNGGTIGIAGAFSPLATFSGGAGYVITNNTVDYNGSLSQTIAAFNYNNLTSSNTGARTLQNGGTIGIAAAFTPGANLYTVTNSTVNFNGTGAQTIPAFNYNNLTTSSARGASNITLANGGTIGIAGAFTLNATFGGGGYIVTNNTVNFNGTGAQTVPAFDFNNLTISGAHGASNVTLVNGGTIGIAAVFNPTATFAGGNYVVTNNTVNFNGSGAQTISAFNYFNLTNSNTGARTLANSGNIGIAGLFTPGTNAYTITGSTIVYNGAAAQTMPNNFLSYNNLTLSNAAGVTGFAATINLSGNWTNNSAIGFIANGSTVNFNGSGAQVIGGSQATTFNNLTIAAVGGVSLGQNINVNGVLTLTNDLTTGANILTMPNTGTSAGAADVIGNVRRTGFAGGGAALSFGNPFNSIGFIVGGTLPTNVTVNLVKAAPIGPPAFPSAVLRTYTITPTGGSGFSATVRLHYLDTELNGNVEVDLGLWRSGAAWARQGRTGAVNVANNWVELSGVTQFSPWTLSSAKNDTTTTITSDTPDPSIPNQVVPINYTVVSNVAGAPAVTGNVTITVNDASGDTCTGSVAAGTCNLTLTTLGSKTLTATYSSDANFNGSSDTEAHDVVPVNVDVKDAQVGEPASGSVNMVFTVTLSNPATSTGSVNFQTADGTATAGTCGSGGDYVSTSGTVTFTTGQQLQTISVPVCADASPEGDETFLVNLSTPTNLTIADGQATGTITPNTPGTVLISEVRTSGPSGSADDFVEIYNNTNSPLTVAASDASAGYGLFKSGAAEGDTPVLIGTIPNGTVIPARGHYLMVGSAYSLTAYAASNLVLTANIENDRNVGLFSTANIANLSSTNRLDAVGFGLNVGTNFDLLREGSTLGAAAGSTAQYSFVRKLTSGLPQDTNDNAADFVTISTDSSVSVGTITPILGGPGPENLASPLQRSATIKASLVDPAQSANVTPNRIRDTNSYTDGLTPSTPNGVPGTPYTLGTLLIRRKFTNNTAAPVTRLRFRVVDISTTNAPPPGQADVRALTSATQPSVTITGGGTIVVNGLTLEQVPTQARGGGLNSSLAAGTVTVGTPIAVGSSINVNFLLGVATGGSYRFFIIVEALP